MRTEWPGLSLREAGVSLLDCEHKTPPARDDGYPYVAIPQLRDGRLDLSGVRLIDAESLAEWTRKTKPTAWDVIVSRRCNPGESAVVPPELVCALGQNLVVLRADGSRVLPRFLRWLVRGPDWWDQIGTYLNVGAVFDSLRCADIPNFSLRIPPLKDQRAIDGVLGALDNKIELNGRMSETLESIARALFRSWFVDFDPVRAKAEGRDPGLPEHLADLFPDSFEDSEWGEIPAGWETCRFRDVTLKSQYGFTASASPTPVGPKFLRITDINKSPWIDWSAVPHCLASAAEVAKYRLVPGDIVIARMADPGHAAMIEDAVEAIFASYLIRFRPEDAAFSRYLQYWTASAGYWNQVRGRQAGSTRATLNARVIGDFTLYVPARPVAEAFGRIVTSLRTRTSAASAETRTLTNLRDTLLPKLISGELRVGDAERVVADAT